MHLILELLWSIAFVLPCVGAALLLLGGKPKEGGHEVRSR